MCEYREILGMHIQLNSTEFASHIGEQVSEFVQQARPSLEELYCQTADTAFGVKTFAYLVASIANQMNKKVKQTNMI